MIENLIAFINASDVIRVTCQRNFSPPVVQIDFPLGLGLSLPYDTYEQIREATGLPDHICD